MRYCITFIITCWIIGITLLAHAEPYTLIENAKGYIREDIVIDKQIIETYDEIPETLEKPECIIICNKLHTIWYEKGVNIDN